MHWQDDLVDVYKLDVREKAWKSLYHVRAIALVAYKSFCCRLLAWYLQNHNRIFLCWSNHRYTGFLICTTRVNVYTWNTFSSETSSTCRIKNLRRKNSHFFARMHVLSRRLYRKYNKVAQAQVKQLLNRIKNESTCYH